MLDRFLIPAELRPLTPQQRARVEEAVSRCLARSPVEGLVFLLLCGAALMAWRAGWRFASGPHNPGLPAGLCKGVPPILVWLIAGVLWAKVQAYRQRPYVWRILRHLCRGCGYDLRGNVSGACSECGRTLDDDRVTDTTLSPHETLDEAELPPEEPPEQRAAEARSQAAAFGVALAIGSAILLCEVSSQFHNLLYGREQTAGHWGTALVLTSVAFACCAARTKRPELRVLFARASALQLIIGTSVAFAMLGNIATGAPLYSPLPQWSLIMIPIAAGATHFATRGLYRRLLEPA